MSVSQSDLLRLARRVTALEKETHEYLTLYKTSMQTTISTADEMITWQAYEAINDKGILAKVNDSIRCKKDCYVIIKTVIHASTLDANSYTKFKLFKNGALFREDVTNRGATTGSSVNVGEIVTEPLKCSAGDYFHIFIQSSDSSINISNPQTGTMFAGEAWLR